MPSEKLTRILKKKSPFNTEQIEALTEAEGWNRVYAHASPRKNKLPMVCFTGFSQTETNALAERAINAGFGVATSVTKSLSFLCTGENAGPAKLAKALAQGVVVMDRAQFENLLETGEIPA
ncbi:MAG: BRCT domain-containing protein [Alphaproteobacteria bacterium]